ncbi:amino acid transporter, partial [Streptomyces sp. NPDC055607]
ESPEKLVVRMWLFPYLTWATIGMIVFVLGYMIYDGGSAREQVVLSLLVAALVVAVAVVRERVGKSSAKL